MVPLGNGLRISLWEWLLGTWYCSNGNKGGRSLIRSFGEAHLGQPTLNLQHLLAKLSLSQVPVHKVPCAFPLLHELGNYSAKLQKSLAMPSCVRRAPACLYRTEF